MKLDEKAANQGSVNAATAKFATLLRQYDSPQKGERHQSVRSNERSNSGRKEFSLVFSKVKRSLYEEKLGMGYLPPINEASKKNLDHMPVLRVKNEQESRNRKHISDKTANHIQMIHSFDPTNLSLPNYSLNYKNEKNAAAFRHLLGGRRDPNSVIINKDLSNSNVQW